MRLVCLHTDTVDALKRLHIQFNDLTPSGLWSSPYHLVGLTLDQFQALEVFGIAAEDVTPAPIAQAVTERASPAAVETSTSDSRPGAAARSASPPASSADKAAREPARAASTSESEVPLAQARDASGRGAEPTADTKGEPKPDSKTIPEASPQAPLPQSSSAQPAAPPQAPVQRGGRGAGPQPAPQHAPPQQANRKAQPVQNQATSGQRYGTTRLRISVAGKYTEATVANGKIIIGSRTFDSPDQAAAELTKSRGDWTFWEYYDSTDGKWRMLTRDWDTVLKSAAPGGR